MSFDQRDRLFIRCEPIQTALMLSHQSRWDSLLKGEIEPQEEHGCLYWFATQRYGCLAELKR